MESRNSDEPLIRLKKIMAQLKFLQPRLYKLQVILIGIMVIRRYRFKKETLFALGSENHGYIQSLAS